LTDDEAKAEMRDNKVWLEELLGREVPHFAYPFGRPAISGEREARIAREVGFDIAVTTDPGSLHNVHGEAQNTLLWPRENGEFQTSVNAGVAWSLNGTWPAIKSRLGNPIVNANSNDDAKRSKTTLEAAE
jgi:peptidoglycan/xylan/chitin deacetylase (PgdA/CDA1 family)